MDENDDFQELLAGLRDGNESAGQELFRRYERFLRAAVRRRLNTRLRTVFDSTDFVQDAWASFVAMPDGRYTFDSSQALLGFLTRVAHNKVVEVVRRRFHTQKEDIARETGLDDEGVQSRGATPSQFAVAAEVWERLLDQFPAGHRPVLERLREGYNYEDIARMTNLSLSTVNRIVRRIKSLTNL